MMGAGIAYAIAIKGISVILKDVSIENAEKGKAYSQKLLDKKVSQGRMSAEKRDQILQLIHPTADISTLEGCDLVIEAVFENQQLKAQVTQQAEVYLNETGVMASNTSTLPISDLAQASRNAAQFIGLHFLVRSTKCNWSKLLRDSRPRQPHWLKPMTLCSRLVKLLLWSMTVVVSLPVGCLASLYRKVCACWLKESIRHV